MMRTVALSDYATLILCAGYFGVLQAHKDVKGDY